MQIPYPNNPARCADCAKGEHAHPGDDGRCKCCGLRILARDQVQGKPQVDR